MSYRLFLNLPLLEGLSIDFASRKEVEYYNKRKDDEAIATIQQRNPRFPCIWMVSTKVKIVIESA